jgi:hypothetical protein
MPKLERVREEIAIRLHTKERSVLKITYEASPYNASWEELTDEMREGYEVISDGGTSEGWFVEMQKNECIEIDE